MNFSEGLRRIKVHSWIFFFCGPTYIQNCVRPALLKLADERQAKVSCTRKAERKCKFLCLAIGIKGKKGKEEDRLIKLRRGHDESKSEQDCVE